MTALVLTGNIVPNAPHTAVEDPAQRASEYAKAIRFYLEQTPYPIYFVENSDHEMEKDPTLAPLLQEERLHVHRDQDPDRPELGKGYGEFRMLDGMVNTLQEEGYQRMIKVTGRYIVRNVQALTPPRRDRAYIDLHPRIKTGIAITSFFICPLSYYLQYLTGAYADVDERERRTIEKVVFDRLHGLREGAPHLLPREPILKGISGTSGEPIGMNPYRRHLRDLHRLLLRAGGWKRMPREL